MDCCWYEVVSPKSNYDQVKHIKKALLPKYNLDYKSGSIKYQIVTRMTNHMHTSYQLVADPKE